MRLDVYLVEHGLAKSRNYASDLIKGALVSVNGKITRKPSFDVTDGTVKVEGDLYSFVGRGGVKLDFALDSFGIDVTGMTAIDFGASTGGFTDCLLQRGAKLVFAVDSGHGQLDPRIACDKRVVNMEGVNARTIDRSLITAECDIAVCDVSFISQTLFAKNVACVLSDGGLFVTLIKPQFECGREALGKGGIVKDKKYHNIAVRGVIDSASRHGLGCEGIVRSPVTGKDGNTEFLAYFKKGSRGTVTDDVIKEVLLC
ncbi:MAG: TlyA family RNA methyltransferase [Clostridia bacterium]|nr:TlyA family RNA methyltransferase [Clostridia bacterium]